uniref:Uncharacterized protein n=1 Tax=Arundo donax TaxID=35708 RepID=A0A0A8YE48_ARUDO
MDLFLHMLPPWCQPPLHQLKLRIVFYLDSTPCTQISSYLKLFNQRIIVILDLSFFQRFSCCSVPTVVQFEMRPAFMAY